MTKLIYILISAYYLLGNLILPCSDFSTLKDLQGMYHHCKATEDQDLTVFDFVTDHMLNIDGAFDRHDHGDRQKPHKPFEFSHTLQTAIFFPLTSHISVRESSDVKTNFGNYDKDFYLSNYTSSILRPPIV